MEDTQILQPWKSYGRQLYEQLLLNRRRTEAITRLKVQSLLSLMKPAKAFALLAGIAWVILVDWVILGVFPFVTGAFLASAITQLVLKLAIGIYAY